MSLARRIVLDGIHLEQLNKSWEKMNLRCGKWSQMHFFCKITEGSLQKKSRLEIDFRDRFWPNRSLKRLVTNFGDRYGQNRSIKCTFFFFCSESTTLLFFSCRFSYNVWVRCYAWLEFEVVLYEDWKSQIIQLIDYWLDKKSKDYPQ